MGLVVVLCESHVLGVESHDEDSEDDDYKDEKDGVRSYTFFACGFVMEA